jgi:hypothetical protein
MKKYFILGYFFGCFLFFLTSEQNLNLAKVEKFDLRLLKNEIVALNLSANKNIFANTYESSIYDVAEVAVKKEKSIPISIDIKTKTKQGKNSIFVEAFQVIRTFPTRPNLNYYDPVENQFVKQSVMLKAHLTCIKQVQNLPREIDKKDKKVTFDKKYSGLFKKNQNYEKVFGYNLYLEENLGKDSSKNKIKQGEQKLFREYEDTSKKYLRENLFENPCIIKSEKCTYLDTDNLVTIYYDEFTDLFAIVDLKENCLLDFGIATEVKYAEIFAYKSSGTLKAREICLSPNEQLVKNFEGSKELEVYQEKYILSYDDAIAVLESRYGPIDALNFITVENGEFKIQEEQAAKKLEHAVCFAINPADYDFSQDQAKEINVKGGIVAYVRKGKTLPNLDLIRAYQNAIKNFCEDRTQSDRNNKSTFRGDPSITFFNEKSRQAVIFNRETKVFITAYKISDDQRDRYIESGEIGQ